MAPKDKMSELLVLFEERTGMSRPISFICDRAALNFGAHIPRDMNTCAMCIDKANFTAEA